MMSEPSTEAVIAAARSDPLLSEERVYYCVGMDDLLSLVSSAVGVDVNMRSANITLFMVFLLPLALVGCGSTYTYSAESVDAVVVDNDSGQPLAGVNVVAYWELHGGGLTGDSLPCGAAGVEEAVTDKDGKFHIPGWGPLKGDCSLRDGFPFLFLFKSGYAYQRLANGMASGKPVLVSRSDWNGATIKLKEYPDLDLAKHGLDSYSADFDGLNGELESFIVDMPAQCNWKRIPNMLRAIMAQQRQFNAAGNNLGSIASTLVDTDKSLLKNAPDCGSPRQYVEGL